MRTRIYPAFFICILIVGCCACNGPRQLYSVSPLISPIPLKKGSVSLDAGYFTHAKPVDSARNHDNAFFIGISHMSGKKVMTSASIDQKKEHDIFPAIHDSLQRLIYNGGFDSSAVNTKRYRAGLAFAYFFHSVEEQRAFIPGIAASVDLHTMDLTESGELKNNPYHRFFKMNQLSFSFQYNMLVKVSKRVNLAYIARLTLVKFLTPKTDYTAEEGNSSGLNLRRKMEVYPCFISGYADYKPFRNIPLYLNGQVFNDLVIWNRAAAKYDPGRTNVRGSGLSLGLKYVIW